VIGIRNYKFGRTVRATNDGNQNQSRQPSALRNAFFGLIPLKLPGRVKASQLYGEMPIVDTLGRARISPIFARFSTTLMSILAIPTPAVPPELHIF
jgi:hypothetical protein